MTPKHRSEEDINKLLDTIKIMWEDKTIDETYKNSVLDMIGYMVNRSFEN